MKYLILGAGPSGLTFANQLLDSHVYDFIILEKEKEVGGLCRTRFVDGGPFDIGGGHFLDVKRPKVCNYIFKFLPQNEWNIFKRNTKIFFRENMMGQPFESHIWQLSAEDQVEYLVSIAKAGCNTGKEMPKDFISWISWKLGDKIAEDYMIPYNIKMFGEEVENLGTYWLDKLPNVSFRDTLMSCIQRKPYGTDPGHSEFYYPKIFGYGEVWKRMGERLDGHILFNKSVNIIDFDNKEILTSDGDIYQANYIISTIPWNSFTKIRGMPDSIKDCVKQLKYSSIQTQYFPSDLNTDAHWIYYPQPEYSFHRILVRSNFCPECNGYWTETNLSRCKNINEDAEFVFTNTYAYPLNTIGKPRIMKNILEYGAKHNVFGLGRWGEHQHYNSDYVVERAMNLSHQLI